MATNDQRQRKHLYNEMVTKQSLLTMHRRLPRIVSFLTMYEQQHRALVNQVTMR